MVWFTGLPSSGKSAVARAVADRLHERGAPVLVLDGDDVRDAVVPRFGYDDRGRASFYETLSRLAAMHARRGMVVLVPATANRARFRERARAMTARFVEVYIRVTPDEALRRDRDKRVYERAVGEDTVPGHGAAFEAPETPDVVATGAEDDAAIETVVDRLSREPGPERGVYVALAVRMDEALLARQAAAIAPFGLLPRKELHVTLAYLGDLSWPRVVEATNLLLRVHTHPAPPSIAVAGTGGIAEREDGVRSSEEAALFDPAQKRVVYWSVVKTEALERLRADVLRRLAPMAVGAAEQAYYPHVTLGSSNPDPAQMVWDVHGVPKLATLARGDGPREDDLTRLHLTSTARAPASLAILKHLADEPQW